MALLEIVTRHYTKRPNLLQNNQKSLSAIRNSNWKQTLLIDDVGRGVEWANMNMVAYAPKLEGKYIWILDDDDMCIYPNIVDDIYLLDILYSPDVIYVKMDHGELGILPNDCWMQPPYEGGIGVSAFIVKRGLWQHCAQYIKPRYSGDFDFAEALYTHTNNRYWHNIVASKVQRISRGEAE